MKRLLLITLFCLWPALVFSQALSPQGTAVKLKDSTGADFGTAGNPINVTGGGGGTQYNQGTVATSTDAMTMAGCVRADTAAVDAGVADGDRVRCIVDSTGRLWVNVGNTVTVTGTVTANQGGTWTVQPGNTANTTAWLVTGTGGTFPATQSGTWTVQPGNTANTTAWKVDGSAVTQPTSIASLPLPSGASTSALQGGGLPAALGAGGGLKIDGSGTALPVSGTVTATQTTATSLKAEVVGPTADNATNPTAKLAVLSGVANALAPTRTEGNVVPLRTNLAGDVAVTLDGEAVVLGAGTAEIGKLAAGTAEIGNVKNSGTFATQATLQTSTAEIGNVKNSGTFATQATLQSGSTTAVTQATATNLNAAVVGIGTAGSPAGNILTVQGVASMTKLLVTPDANSAVNLAQIAGSTAVADPCQVNAKSYGNINQTSGTQLITGTAAKKIYFCSFNVVAAAAQNIAMVAGTGSVCATTTVAITGLSGGTTAATGWNLAANGGLTFGNGGNSIAATTVNADNACLLQSGTAQLSGGFSYVVQ